MLRCHQKSLEGFLTPPPRAVSQTEVAEATSRSFAMRRGLANVTMPRATGSDRPAGQCRKAKTDYLVGGRFRLLLKFLDQARMAEPDASGVDET